MSWFSRLLFGPPASAANVMSGPMLPFSPDPTLAAMVYSDIYGPTGADAVTRESAMSVAPIGRGRAVIVGRLADLVWEQGEMVDGEFVPDSQQPAWLTATKTPQTCWHRFAWSLDDVLFTGWALWVLERDETGQIIDAARLARHRWGFDTESPTGVAIDQKPVTDERSVLLIAGPDDGLLIKARETIRGWRYMERAWVGRVRNPIPLVVLHEKDANGVTQEEAKAYVEAFAAARTSDNGAIGFLPASLDLEVYGEIEADLYDKGRNAARIDVANAMNLPVSYLDGSTATSSLTYVTQEGTRNQIIDDLEYWIAPFEARLSEADVTGTPGKVIRLNRSNLSSVPNDVHGATNRAATEPEEAAE